VTDAEIRTRRIDRRVNVVRVATALALESELPVGGSRRRSSCHVHGGRRRRSGGATVNGGFTVSRRRAARRAERSDAPRRWFAGPEPAPVCAEATPRRL